MRAAGRRTHWSGDCRAGLEEFARSMGFHGDGVDARYLRRAGFEILPNAFWTRMEDFGEAAQHIFSAL